jgi:hypothetical protein
MVLCNQIKDGIYKIRFTTWFYCWIVQSKGVATSKANAAANKARQATDIIVSTCSVKMVQHIKR